jgi:hypothetical protein
MLYYLTKSDALLPGRLNGSDPQNPAAWSDGVHLTQAQWDARLTVMRREHPVVIFSKVSPFLNSKCCLLIVSLDLLPVSDTPSRWLLAR